MHTGKAHIDETFIHAGRAARIACAPNLVPAPGQYVLAHASSEPDAPLPHPVFMAASHSTGFYAAQPLPVAWTPGTELILHGPLGRGFNLPASARKVALAAFGNTCSRLLSLLEPAFTQKAEIVLLTDNPPEGLPLEVEISPLSGLSEVAQWAEYIAVDIPRAAIHAQLEPISPALYSGYTTEILIETPLPCGGMAECAACAVHTNKGYHLACKDGPVFELKSILKQKFGQH